MGWVGQAREVLATHLVTTRYEKYLALLRHPSTIFGTGTQDRPKESFGSAQDQKNSAKGGAFSSGPNIFRPNSIGAPPKKQGGVGGLFPVNNS